MPPPKFQSVDAYFTSLPENVRTKLKVMRGTLREALPGAEEVISYNIPAFRLNGRLVLYYAGWKEHCALYPGSSMVVARFSDELAQYDVGKGTIRFPLSKPLPKKLITKLARFRAGEIAARVRPAGSQ